ncbi:MAG: MCE family protein [Candidatus Cloacimonetes bacterium]|nr:MCE family protein [Candidatus Cloacimonadota bacterium]
MVSKAQKFRLGLFITVFSTLMIVFIILVAGNKLMEKRDYYSIKYSEISVSGLQVGGSVKFYGINVGRVDDIIIDPDDIRNVIVKISVKEGTPIKRDMTAALTPVGITGLLQVELRGGTNEADLLEPGSIIKAGVSTFENISGKAEILSEKLELVMNNFIELTGQENKDKINNIISNVDNFIVQSQQPFGRVITELDTMSKEITLLVKNLNETTTKINNVLASEHFNNIMSNTDKFTSELGELQVGEVVNNLNKTILEVDNAVRQINITHLSGKQDLLVTLEKLRETIDYLNEFSRMLTEDPTILLRGK